MSTAAPYWELAVTLRCLRGESGLTYRALAERIDRAGCSAATLSRADQGDTLPAQEVVVAYGVACGTSETEMRALWTRARNSRRPSARDLPGRGRLGPSRRSRTIELIYEPAHLLAAMHGLHDAAGRPSLRDLERRARVLGLTALPKSTLADVLTGTRLPNEAQLLSFVRCCGGDEVTLVRWRSAHHRVLAELTALRPVSPA